MQLELTYSTRYEFTPRAAASLTALRLRPRSRPGLVVRNTALTVDPGAPAATYIDGFGTVVDLVQVRDHTTVTYQMSAVVDTRPVEQPMPVSPGERYLYLQDSARVRRAAIREVGWTPSMTGDWSTVEAALGWVHSTYEYSVGDTDAETSLEEFLRMGRGVCQDFAHALLAMLRAAGWCARYVSGYVFSSQDADAGRIEAEAMHAWVEVLHPESGWVGVDPTTGRLTDDRYVAVGVGRDYDDVRPVRGVVRGAAKQTHEARLRIERISSQ